MIDVKNSGIVRLRKREVVRENAWVSHFSPQFDFGNFFVIVVFNPYGYKKVTFFFRFLRRLYIACVHTHTKIINNEIYWWRPSNKECDKIVINDA